MDPPRLCDRGGALFSMSFLFVIPAGNPLLPFAPAVA
jgi:hypothetical protein